MGRSRREKEQQDHDVEAGEEGADRENRGEDQEATLKTLPEPREETGPCPSGAREKPARSEQAVEQRAVQRSADRRERLASRTYPSLKGRNASRRPRRKFGGSLPTGCYR
jgi:hypothetical protein